MSSEGTRTPRPTTVTIPAPAGYDEAAEVSARRRSLTINVVALRRHTHTDRFRNDANVASRVTESVCSSSIMSDRSVEEARFAYDVRARSLVPRRTQSGTVSR